MTETELRPYSKLYLNSQYMGADNLFRRFYGLPNDAIVPMSLAHGVDFGHTPYPMDVKSIEPIHWACNAFTHSAASVFKPTILLPHPWAMHSLKLPVTNGKGVLVIGPPPSPANDMALSNLICGDIRNDWSILVKARGKYCDSMRFWMDRGLKPVTAKGSDINSYNRLSNIISQYETIVGCTFSSALVFAASIGKRIEFVKDFTYSYYETFGYESNYCSSRPRSVVQTFLKGYQPEIQELSRDLLGFEQGSNKQKVVKDFNQIKSNLKRPFWNDQQVWLPYYLREFFAMRLGKAAIVNAKINTYLNHFIRKKVCIKSINELDLWLNGKTINNYNSSPCKYVPGVTEPGYGAEGYLE